MPNKFVKGHHFHVCVNSEHNLVYFGCVVAARTASN